MDTVTKDSWKDRIICIHTFPVRRTLTRDSTPDGYIATVRIEREGNVRPDGNMKQSLKR
jgi:hypothetical protein